MNPLDPALFGLDAPGDGPGPGPHPPGHLPRLLEMVNHAAVLQAEIMICLFGLALLLLLIAPDRHRRAVERLGGGGLRCFLSGSMAIGLVLAALAALLATGIRPGRPLLLVLTVAGAATGLSVCARVLGERMWPERGVVAQTCLGLTALILPLACLPGWPVLLVAAPLGLGAWLRPARDQGVARRTEAGP